MLRRLLSISLLLPFVLSGCASDKSDMKKLTETLRMYSATIRWGDFAQALAFVDPVTLKKNPVSALELERYHQVQVSSYNDSDPVMLKPGEMQVMVEIGLVNVNTQTGRSLVDKQLWHWDAQQKRWWLMTGLPDITHH